MTRLLIVAIIIHLWFPLNSFASCAEIEELHKGTHNPASENNIDEKYRKVIYQMFFELEKGRHNIFDQCCVKLKNDRIMFFVCKLVEYRLFKKPGIFLSDIPTDETTLRDLWEIDRITMDPFGYAGTHPNLFDKGSFADIFLEAIYQLAVKGNRIAIDRLLVIDRFADGAYAETVQERVLEFLYELSQNDH